MATRKDYFNVPTKKLEKQLRQFRLEFQSKSVLMGQVEQKILDDMAAELDYRHENNIA